MKESSIEINGRQITPAMAMTVRVAIESFAGNLDENGLGDDEHGNAMVELYMKRINEIRTLMYRES